MNTLQFIDSLTGKLAWPIAAIILGLLFRRSLIQLLGRVRRLKWGDREAELVELAEAEDAVQDAVEEAAKPLPDDGEQSELARRDRIERLMQEAAAFGFITARRFPSRMSLPETRIEWDGDQPTIVTDRSPIEARLWNWLVQARLKDHRPE